MNLLFTSESFNKFYPSVAEKNGKMGGKMEKWVAEKTFPPSLCSV
jgi:hypothetical protein